MKGEVGTLKGDIEDDALFVDNLSVDTVVKSVHRTEVLQWFLDPDTHVKCPIVPTPFKGSSYVYN